MKNLRVVANNLKQMERKGKYEVLSVKNLGETKLGEFYVIEIVIYIWKLKFKGD